MKRTRSISIQNCAARSLLHEAKCCIVQGAVHTAPDAASAHAERLAAATSCAVHDVTGRVEDAAKGQSMSARPPAAATCLATDRSTRNAAAATQPCNSVSNAPDTNNVVCPAAAAHNASATSAQALSIASLVPAHVDADAAASGPQPHHPCAEAPSKQQLLPAGTAAPTSKRMRASMAAPPADSRAAGTHAAPADVLQPGGMPAEPGKVDIAHVADLQSSKSGSKNGTGDKPAHEAKVGSSHPGKPPGAHGVHGSAARAQKLVDGMGEVREALQLAMQNLSGGGNLTSEQWLGFLSDLDGHMQSMTSASSA